MNNNDPKRIYVAQIAWQQSYPEFWNGLFKAADTLQPTLSDFDLERSQLKEADELINLIKAKL
jgi:hypothetical protein